MKKVFFVLMTLVIGFTSVACTTDAVKARWNLQDPYRDKCEAYNERFLKHIKDHPRTEDEQFLDFGELVTKRCKENPEIYCNPPRRPENLPGLETTMGWSITPDRCIQAQDGSFNWPN